MKLQNVNDLAAAFKAHGRDVPTIKHLKEAVGDLIGPTLASVHFTGPLGFLVRVRENSKLPSAKLADMNCRIAIRRTNGLTMSISFPTDVEALNRKIGIFRHKQTKDEKAFEEFKSKLLAELDPCERSEWSVGNDDWTAYADADVGWHMGKRYVAIKVVVDCESGHFAETSENRVVPADGPPEKDILLRMAEHCILQYFAKQHLKAFRVKVRETRKANDSFNAHLAGLWSAVSP